MVTKNAIINKLLTIIFIVFLLGCGSNLSKEENIKEISGYKLESYSKYFEEIEEWLNEEKGKLWNLKLNSPILLVDPKSRFIIANQVDKEGILTKHGEVFTGTLPNEINISNTSVEWKGKRWAMIMLPLPGNYHRRLNLVIHEIFHRVQPKLGFNDLFETQSNHLDSKEGRVLLTLELEALKKALSSNNKDQVKKHLNNALVIRNQRHIYIEGAQKAENSLEINEGVCEFTGSFLSKRNDETLKKHFINKINGFYKNATYVRSFAYVTIPVYGYFLSQVNPNWNLSLSRESNLTEVFSKSFKQDYEHSFNDIKKQYGYSEIEKRETAIEKEKLRIVSEYEERFLKSPVLELRFQNMNVSFEYENIVPLGDVGTVYPVIRVTDNWGILNVTKGGLLSKNWDFIKVTEPTDIYNTKVKGEGWELEIKEGWEIVKNKENYLLKKK